MPHKYNSVFGWTDFQDIYEAAVESYDNCLFVEIGSFQGKSAVMMGELIKEKGKNIRLVCIDMFPTKDELLSESEKGVGQGAECGIINDLPKSLLDTFVENIRRCEVDDVIIPVKSDSHKAALLFPNNSLPFIFLDAAHHKEAVLKDLELWWPKLKDFGTMAGHDFNGPVAEAVFEFFGPLGVSVYSSGGSWIVYKE